MMGMVNQKGALWSNYSEIRNPLLPFLKTLYWRVNWMYVMNLQMLYFSLFIFSFRNLPSRILALLGITVTRQFLSRTQTSIHTSPRSILYSRSFRIEVVLIESWSVSDTLPGAKGTGQVVPWCLTRKAPSNTSTSEAQWALRCTSTPKSAFVWTCHVFDGVIVFVAQRRRQKQIFKIQNFSEIFTSKIAVSLLSQTARVQTALRECCKGIRSAVEWFTECQWPSPVRKTKLVMYASSERLYRFHLGNIPWPLDAPATVLGKAAQQAHAIPNPC